MGDYKGSAIVMLRKILKAKGPQFQQAFGENLTPDQQRYFESLVPATWVPIDLAEVYVQKAAAILYPNDPEAFFKLGEVRAEDTIKGMYKMMFNLMSTEAIIDASYRLWPIMHSQGQASVVRTPGAKEATFAVSGYPDLPRSFRLMMSGFIHGCLKLGKARNIKLRLIESDPDNWQWTGTWE